MSRFRREAIRSGPTERHCVQCLYSDHPAILDGTHNKFVWTFAMPNMSCRPGERRDPQPLMSAVTGTVAPAERNTNIGGYRSRLALRLAGTTRIEFANLSSRRNTLHYCGLPPALPRALPAPAPSSSAPD